MRLNKKKVFVLALALCLLATLSLGSLAWFTDSDSAKNDFMIAGSDDKNPDDIFSVDVWEDKDENGIPDDDVDGDAEGLVYEDILPGDKLKKTVHVQNTGSYAQYIRITVTISDAQAWINALGDNFDVTQIFVGFDIGQWTHIWNNLNEAAGIPEDIVYAMYYKHIVAPDEDVVVFTDVQIPTTLTQAQAAAFAGGFSIDLKAEAVQTQNVVPAGTAYEDAAWAAFKSVEGVVTVANQDEMKAALQNEYTSRVVVAEAMNVVIDYEVENKILDFNGTNSTVKFTSAANGTNMSVCGIRDTDGADVSVQTTSGFQGEVTVYDCVMLSTTNAISVGGGNVTVASCRISGAEGADKLYGIVGGGANNNYTGNLTLLNTTLQNLNRGIYINQISGTLTVKDCVIENVTTFLHNSGGTTGGKVYENNLRNGEPWPAS